MRKIKIKPELLSLLTSGEFKHFRSEDLIDAYQKLPSSSKLNHRQVQQLGTPHYKEVTPQAAEPQSPKVDPLLQLQDQLSAHKLELLTTIAETEEYEALCQQLPSKQPEIQELYNDARNRYSKTLGKMKAIESLILRTSNRDQ